MVERRPRELSLRVGFLIAKIARAAEGVVAFENKRESCKQHIKDASARSNGRGGRVTPSPPRPCAFSFTLAHNVGDFLEPSACSPVPVVTLAASAGCPSSCVLAALSSTAGPCQELRAGGGSPLDRPP